MSSLAALVMLLPIERNENVTSNSQCNTKFLTPQPEGKACERLSMKVGRTPRRLNLKNRAGEAPAELTTEWLSRSFVLPANELIRSSRWAKQEFNSELFPRR